MAEKCKWDKGFLWHHRKMQNQSTHNEYKRKHLSDVIKDCFDITKIQKSKTLMWCNKTHKIREIKCIEYLKIRYIYIYILFLIFTPNL